jgi:hypothetical protein
MRNLVKTLLLISLLAGCKDDPHKKGTSSSDLPKTPPDNTVAIYVDDQQVGKIAPDQVNLWPRLDQLVPVAARRLGTWQTVTVKGQKSTDIQQPSSTHPELVPALFPNEAGAPSFGMFDPVELAKHGKPALREDAIREVRIALAKDGMRGQNDHSDGAAAGDPTKLELTIKTSAGEQMINGGKLLETPREPEPGEMGGEPKGWTLAAVLGRVGVKSYERLLLTGEKGTNLTLEKQDLDPKAAVPFIKLNRQGSLRFRVFKKQGDTWQPAQDLRGLVRVEVLK